jgi:hypothetical protein
MRTLLKLPIFSLMVVCIVLRFTWYDYSLKNINTVHTNHLSRSEILEVLRRTGSRIKQLLNKTTQICQTKRFGQFGSKVQAPGAHSLCIIPPKQPCLFYSFGISNDCTFDRELADTWKCQGLSFDPSVVHRSQLHPTVTFHMIAARTLSDEDDSHWPLVASIPALKKCFKHERINVLKMDCEGCEFSLARDVENEMPDFFSFVDQVAVEIHVSKFWMKTWTHVMNLAKLFALLNSNNLQLADVDMGPCAGFYQSYGCSSALLEAGYPCATNMTCQNLLFARI